MTRQKRRRIGSMLQAASDALIIGNTLNVVFTPSQRRLIELFTQSELDHNTSIRLVIKQYSLLRRRAKLSTYQQALLPVPTMQLISLPRSAVSTPAQQSAPQLSSQRLSSAVSVSAQQSAPQLSSQRLISAVSISAQQSAHRLSSQYLGSAVSTSAQQSAPQLSNQRLSSAVSASAQQSAAQLSSQHTGSAVSTPAQQSAPQLSSQHLSSAAST